MKPEHDQYSEDNREPHAPGQVGEEVLGRPGPPHQHDGGSEKPRVERSDLWQDEDLGHSPV